MKPLLTCRIGFGLLVCAVTTSPPAAAGLKWHAVAATDYVIQGISQTRGDASLQAGASYAHVSGAFGGIWLAENSLITGWYQQDDETIEVDYYAGYEYLTEDRRPWTFTLTHYTYPDEPDYRAYRYSELTASTALTDNISVTMGLSENLYDRGETSRFYEVMYKRALNQRTALTTGIGYQDLEPLYGQGYSYWNIGVSRIVGDFTFDLSYIDTHGNAREIFGDTAAGARWVFSIAVTAF